MKHEWPGEKGVEFDVAKRPEDILYLAVEFRIALTRIDFCTALPERRFP